MDLSGHSSYQINWLPLLQVLGVGWAPEIREAFQSWLLRTLQCGQVWEDQLGQSDSWSPEFKTLNTEKNRLWTVRPETQMRSSRGSMKEEVELEPWEITASQSHENNLWWREKIQDGRKKIRKLTFRGEYRRDVEITLARNFYKLQVLRFLDLP